MRTRSFALFVSVGTAAAMFTVPAGATHGGNVDFIAVFHRVFDAGRQAGLCTTLGIFAAQPGSPFGVAEGEIVDVSISQSDADDVGDIQLGFCDPDGSGPATDLSGTAHPPIGQQTPSGGVPATDCDDDGVPLSASPGTSGNDCANPPATGPEGAASVQEECQLDIHGECWFGVLTSEPGDVRFGAWFEGCPECSQDNVFGLGIENGDRADYPFTQSTPLLISCTPTNDTNPSGTNHEWGCLVTDNSGLVSMGGVGITFDVIEGPNAEEVGPTGCVFPTNALGETTCEYSDDLLGANNSPPGTDWILVYLNLPGPGHTSGTDPIEVRLSIFNTWTSVTSPPDPYFTSAP